MYIFLKIRHLKSKIKCVHVSLHAVFLKSVAAGLSEVDAPIFECNALYHLGVSLGNCDGILTTSELVDVVTRYAALINNMTKGTTADYSPIKLPSTLTPEESRCRLEPMTASRHFETSSYFRYTS